MNTETSQTTDSAQKLGVATGSAPSHAWRDLQIGEVLQAGDRTLSRSCMTWETWTAEDINSRRPVVIDKHTTPAQRLVVLQNNSGQTRPENT